MEVTSHEGGALWNEISALIRRDTCDIMAICKPERGLSLDKEFSGILTLDFPASRTVKTNVCDLRLPTPRPCLPHTHYLIIAAGAERPPSQPPLPPAHPPALTRSASWSHSSPRIVRRPHPPTRLPSRNPPPSISHSDLQLVLLRELADPVLNPKDQKAGKGRSCQLCCRLLGGPAPPLVLSLSL